MLLVCKVCLVYKALKELLFLNKKIQSLPALACIFSSFLSSVKQNWILPLMANRDKVSNQAAVVEMLEACHSWV